MTAAPLDAEARRRALLIAIHKALTARAAILTDEAVSALRLARSPAEKREIVRYLFNELAVEIDILEASMGEPPATAAARALAKRGQRLRASLDPEARALGRRLVLAAHSTTPARQLAVTLGLSINRPRHGTMARDTAIAKLARHRRYAAAAGDKPRCVKIASDLRAYMTSTWLHDRTRPDCPYNAGSWHALAWQILKTDHREPHWKKIQRAVRKIQ